MCYNASEMESKINSEFLKKMGVYELRELARQVGVESPTTKKRAELCDQILKICSGEIQPSHAAVNKGRPPKSISRVLGLVEDIFPKELLTIKPESPKQPELSNFLVLSQNHMPIRAYENEKAVEGYIKTYSGKFYLLNKETYPFNSSKVVYVPNKLVEELNLREGDKIKGTYLSSDGEDEYVSIEQINLVNNKEISSHLATRKDLTTNFACRTVEKLNFMGKELQKGARSLVEFENISSAVERVIDVIDNDNSDMKYIFVGSELTPEDLFFVQSRNKIEKFATGIGQNLKLISNNVNNAINHAETLLADGNKVSIIVFDLIGLLNGLDMHFASDQAGEYQGHRVSSIQAIKKLVGLGRAISEDAYLNTVSVVLSIDKNNEFIGNQLRNILTNFI